MDDYVVAGNVTVTKPSGERVIYSFVKHCPRGHVQAMIAYARREAAIYLEERDLLFGCTIGPLEVRTGPQDWTIPPAPPQLLAEFDPDHITPPVHRVSPNRRPGQMPRRSGPS